MIVEVRGLSYDQASLTPYLIAIYSVNNIHSLIYLYGYGLDCTLSVCGFVEFVSCPLQQNVSFYISEEKI